MPDLKRVEREIKQCQKDTETSVKVELVADSLMHLRGSFKGPEDTCYQGGTFLVDIQISDQYPFAPPKMKFITPVYHPNVSSQTGAICLDILKDAWTPVLTLKTALISLQSLLCDPQPDDPQDAQVAAHFKKDRNDFEKTAREWTIKHANGIVDLEYGLDKNTIQRIVDMGFSREVVVDALRKTGNEESAVEMILSSL